MPRRTNDFQELVTLIEQTFAPVGAKVTPSGMVDVPGLDPTEVDVLIEGHFGPYRMKVAVETRDHNRPLDMPQFREYMGKYRGECRAPVDAHVPVTRRGYTAQVREAAKKADVELLTVDEAKNRDWSQFRPAELRFEISPHICNVEFTPPIKCDPPRELLDKGRMICPHGHDHGTVRQRASCLFFHKWLPARPELIEQIHKGLANSPQGQAMVSCSSVSIPGWRVLLGDEEFEVSSWILHAHFVSARGKMECKEYERKSSKGPSRFIKHVQGIAGGKEISLAIPFDPETGQPLKERIALRIESPAASMPSEKKASPKKGKKSRKKKAANKNKK